MLSRTGFIGYAALLSTLLPGPVHAQVQAAAQAQAITQPVAKDPGVTTAQQSSRVLKLWLTGSAELMSEADYAFKPTPEVRSFGQLMGHVADRNYEFCAAAMGVERPVRDIEKTKVSKADLQKSLSESFAFCENAYGGMSPAKAGTLIQFHGQAMPALSTLLFLNMHNSLHYGNAITYLRLRGKVPPSTSSPITSD
ncbi:MAG: hypothetical protein JWL61_3484 [Gemmatimonadetes bacterium]|nr:hypothetical protein [Gemmatimonadota bacterium]